MVVLFLLLSLANKFFQGKLFAGVAVLDQEYVSVSALGYLAQLAQSMSGDIVDSGCAYPLEQVLAAITHNKNIIVYR